MLASANCGEKHARAWRTSIFAEFDSSKAMKHTAGVAPAVPALRRNVRIATSKRYYPVSEANRPHQLDETGEGRDGVLVGEPEADV